MMRWSLVLEVPVCALSSALPSKVSTRRASRSSFLRAPTRSQLRCTSFYIFIYMSEPELHMGVVGLARFEIVPGDDACVN